MSDLRELYQTVILDHAKKPRNFRVPEDANRDAEGFNPLCGDKITVHVTLEDDVVRDLGFQVIGRPISTSSASLMTELVKGGTRTEAEATFERFHELVTSDRTTRVDLDALGKLAVFGGVREFPMRVKCATLAWHTMKAALAGSRETVKTE